MGQDAQLSTGNTVYTDSALHDDDDVDKGHADHSRPGVAPHDPLLVRMPMKIDLVIDLVSATLHGLLESLSLIHVLAW